MQLGRLTFRAMYGVGFTPWDRSPLPARLVELVEGADALPPGRALDLGCGTGGAAIYLARHGWEAVGVDFTRAALSRARAKAAAAGASVRFIDADATRLRESGARPGFDLILDFGLMHSMGVATRRLYGAEIAAVAAPGAAVLISAFPPGSGSGLPGVNEAGALEALGPAWSVAHRGRGARSPLRGQGRLGWFELRAEPAVDPDDAS